MASAHKTSSGRQAAKKQPQGISPLLKMMMVGGGLGLPFGAAVLNHGAEPAPERISDEPSPQRELETAPEASPPLRLVMPTAPVRAENAAPLRETLRATAAIPPLSYSFNEHASTTPQISDREMYAQLIDHLYSREGKKNKVYLCSEGHPTVGVGHKVRACDNLSVGDRISEDQVRAFLEQDARAAFAAAKSQAKDAGISDPDFIIALGSVNFQLGTGWRTKFSKTWEMICEGRYEEAAQRLNNTKWNAQTPRRVEDFQRALRRIDGKTLSFHPRDHIPQTMGYAFNGAAINDPFTPESNADGPTPIDIRDYATNGASVLTLTA